jgi:site-specific DNA-cytosine methylase
MGARKLRALDLFSGIAGFAIAFAKFARTVGFCDNEPASRGVLQRKIESGELDDAPSTRTCGSSTRKTCLRVRTEGTPWTS